MIKRRIKNVAFAVQSPGEASFWALKSIKYLSDKSSNTLSS